MWSTDNWCDDPHARQAYPSRAQISAFISGDIHLFSCFTANEAVDIAGADSPPALPAEFVSIHPPIS
jgi:hypothetical protein